MVKEYFILFLAILGIGFLAAEQIIEKPVKGRERDSITLRTTVTFHNIETITWTFGAGSLTPRIASYTPQNGMKIHSDQFRDRLLLDRHTGSLNITDLNINDTGVYQLQVISDNVLSTHRFNLTVYRPVFKPYVRRVNPSSEEKTSKVCVLECSVIHVREVMLSLYKGQQRVSNTSRPEPNNNLTLGVKVSETDTDEYSCVAENPVSKSCVDLNITELCLHGQDPDGTSNVVLYILIAQGAVICVYVLFLISMVGRINMQVGVGRWRNEGILTYSSIRIQKAGKTPNKDLMSTVKYVLCETNVTM